MTASQPTTNAAAFAAAQAVIPGGVDSPVRAFGSVGGTPRFMAGARGPYLTDVEGNEYVDLVCSWGPMLLGHQHPEVLERDHRALRVAHGGGDVPQGGVVRIARAPGRPQGDLPGRHAARGRQRAGRNAGEHGAHHVAPGCWRASHCISARMYPRYSE